MTPGKRSFSVPMSENIRRILRMYRVIDFWHLIRMPVLIFYLKARMDFREPLCVKKNSSRERISSLEYRRA